MKGREAALIKKSCCAIVVAWLLAACVPGHTSRYCNNAKPDPEDPSRPEKDCKSEVIKGDTPGSPPSSVLSR
jgi:hypothetical protein